MKKTDAIVKVGKNNRVTVSKEHKDEVSKLIISYLDVAVSSTGRSTFYNSKEDQEKALETIHDTLFGLDRGLYAAMLCLPGVNDHNRQKGVNKLLCSGYSESNGLVITPEQEKNAIVQMVESMPVTRALKLFQMLKSNRVNNNRTRKIILRSVFGTNNLELWSVKYRVKLRNALTHAWGLKKTNAIRNVVAKSKSNRDESDDKLLQDSIDKYLNSTTNIEDIYECIAFVLKSDRETYSLPLIKAYFESRNILSKGSRLPKVTLEGIRSRFHDNRKDKTLPDGWDMDDVDMVDPKEVLELTKEFLDTKQKLRMQKEAKKSGVEVKIDAKKQSIVDLYVYALETGEMTEEMAKAIKAKAKKVGEGMPFRYGKIQIILDTSKSMCGNETAKNRPMAVALAMKDILKSSATNKRSSGIICTGEKTDSKGLVEPSGETSLSESLITALEKEPDAVFMVTDGYENAPAGRVNEVINSVRNMGIDIPIYQMSPVTAAESGGVRSLSDKIAAMPVSNPEAIGLSMVRSIIESDINNGIKSLIEMSKLRIGE